MAICYDGYINNEDMTMTTYNDLCNINLRLAAEQIKGGHYRVALDYLSAALSAANSARRPDKQGAILAAMHHVRRAVQ